MELFRNPLAGLSIDFSSGKIQGSMIREIDKHLSELQGVFYDEGARQRMSGEQIIYRVQLSMPVRTGTEGGLFFGNTTIEPGKVGDEYFMTKGHFHRIRNRGEYYLAVEGEGALLLMEESGATRAETMLPGSLHYIPGSTAHRVANTGSRPLTFLACWPADAGHDYETIERQGFGARMIERDGKPALVPWEQ